MNADSLAASLFTPFLIAIRRRALTCAIVFSVLSTIVGCTPSPLTLNTGGSDAKDVGESAGTVPMDLEIPQKRPENRHDQPLRPSLATDDSDPTDTAGILRRLADFYRGVPAFVVRSEIEMQVLGAALPSTVRNHRTITIKLPNQFAFIGDKKSQFAVVSDGRTLTTFLPVINQYTRVPGFSSIDEILHTPLASVPGGQVGSFALHLAASDPADALMEDVVKATYAGRVDLDGLTVHQLEFLQIQRIGDVESPINWTLWISAIDQPLLVKIQIVSETPAREASGGKKLTLILTERLLDWDLAPELEEETFQFTPPEGANEVPVLFEGMPPRTNPHSGQSAP